MRWTTINDDKLPFTSDLKTSNLNLKKKSSFLPLLTCTVITGSFASKFYLTLLAAGNGSTVVGINLHKIASTAALMMFPRRAQGMQT